MQACCLNIPSNFVVILSIWRDRKCSGTNAIGEVNCSEFWWFETAQYAQYAHCTMCNALACITIERASQWWLDRTTGSSVTMVCTLTPSEPGTDNRYAACHQVRADVDQHYRTRANRLSSTKGAHHGIHQPKNELFSLKVDKVNFNQTDRMIWAESPIYRKAQKLKSYCVPDSERLTVRHVAKSIPDDISLEQLPKQRMPMTDRVQRNFTKQSKQRTRMKQVSLLQMPFVGSCQN